MEQFIQETLKNIGSKKQAKKMNQIKGKKIVDEKKANKIGKNSRYEILVVWRNKKNYLLEKKYLANFKISLSLQQDLNTDEAVYNITQQIFSPATPPSSIPLYVSQIAELSPNRQYILENNYSQINQSIQNSYDIALNAIFHYTDSMNPYDPDSAEAVGTMLNSITQNPHISTLDNIKRVDDAIGNLQAKIYGKSNLHDEEIQTLVDVSNNIFQIKSDFLENQTDSIKEVDNTMSKINAMALESMVVHEQNDFFSERIESKVSIQYTDDLKNFTETVKNSSIILSHNINDFLYKKPLVGTSFINYDPIPSEENALALTLALD